MPITPRYSITQTSTHITVEVSIPHVRVSPTNLDLAIIDGTELHLYAPPTYLLKLTLPDRVVDENGVEESLASSVCASDIVNVEGAGEEVGKTDNHDDNANIGTSEPHSQLWTADDLPKMKYNPEKNHGTLILLLRKEKERFWHDLDLLGRLQQPMNSRKDKNSVSLPTNPLVTELGETDNANEEYQKVDGSTAPDVLGDLLFINRMHPKYGLFQSFSNVFRDYAREGLVHEMMECQNPDEETSCSASDNISTEFSKRQMRLDMENNKFDTDRYLNDLHAEEEEDMIFDTAMRMVPHWIQSSDYVSLQHSLPDSVDIVTNGMASLSTCSDTNAVFFTADESHLLATLPPQHKTIPMQVTAEERRSAFLTLIDVLFAYAYDHRTTDGEPTVESSWTVMILSPSFSWLENFNPPYDTMLEVIRWSIRRSLIYPYLRVYSLSKRVVDDVCQIVIGGRRTIIRCLLQLHRIMERSDCHYLFNKLYIDPLICWIQQCDEVEVIELGKEMFMLTKKETPLNSDAFKDSLGLGLVELERTYFESITTE